MLYNLAYSAFLFFISLSVFIVVFSKLSKLFDKRYTELKINNRILSILNKGISIDSADDLEHEDIGLTNRKKNLLDHDSIKKIIYANKEWMEKIKILLMKSGKRDESDFIDYIIYNNIVLGMFLSIGCYYALKVYIYAGLPFFLEVIICGIAGIILGFYIATIQLKGRADKRQERLNDGVPDLIDLLVICTESGLDLHRSVMRVAREMRNSNIELSDELTITAVEMEMIPDSKQVFLNLEERIDSPQVKSLAKTLSQSIEYGSSLSSMLRDLSAESRQRRMLLAEERAARIPTFLTLPLMLFILPCLFIVMLGPAIIDVMQNFNQ